MSSTFIREASPARVPTTEPGEATPSEDSPRCDEPLDEPCDEQLDECQTAVPETGLGRTVEYRVNRFGDAYASDEFGTDDDATDDLPQDDDESETVPSLPGVWAREEEDDDFDDDFDYDFDYEDEADVEEEFDDEDLMEEIDGGPEIDFDEAEEVIESEVIVVADDEEEESDGDGDDKDEGDKAEPADE